MVLIDVNLLVFAESPRHQAAREWLDTTLAGTESVALPWAVLASFIRLSTNPRVMSQPLTLEDAISYLDDWLAIPLVRTVGPTVRHREVFVKALRNANATGNLVSDAYLAAVAIRPYRM